MGNVSKRNLCLLPKELVDTKNSDLTIQEYHPINGCFLSQMGVQTDDENPNVLPMTFLKY